MCPKTCTCPPFSNPCQDHHWLCTPLFCASASKPTESLADRIKRLKAELSKAEDQERQEANRAYQLKLGQWAKKCSGGDAGPDHIWLCNEISVHSDSQNPWSPRTESGKYHCACGARMSITR